MEAGKLIKSERDKRGWSQADLAKRVDISQPAIKKIEDGKTVKSKHLPKIAEVLEISLSQLDASLSQAAPVNLRSLSDESTVDPEVTAPNTVPSNSGTIPAIQLLGERDLPVYGIVQGGTGALILSNEAVDRVVRPDPLLRVREGYGVIVVGDSMEPALGSGDIALINPHLPPRSGDTCIFRHRDEYGTETACIKYLRRITEKEWQVSEWNSAEEGTRRDFKLSRSHWHLCHVMVASYKRR